ncbi:MAG: hypothetical protein GQ574_01310 [Crocinitomix sp.]|nr:hypothetical protein [Crocinitomix sp.]
MKSILYIILIFLASSCSNQPDLEGLWQKTGDYDSLGIKLEETDLVYLSFDEDSVVSIQNSWRSRHTISTSAYGLTDSTLIIGKGIYNYVFNDSLTLFYNEGYSTIFKKLGSDKRTKYLDEIDLNGFYHMVRNDSDITFHFEFFQDSLFQHDRDYCSEYHYGKWKVLEINEISFLDTYGFFPLIRIDWCSENEVRLAPAYDGKDKYNLEKYEPDPIREKFVDNWTITSAKESDYFTENDTNLYEITSITVDPDSLCINGENSKIKWLISMDEEYILFPDIDFYTSESSWSLIELADYKMKLGIYADYEIKAVLTFLKAPHESDNPFDIHK